MKRVNLDEVYPNSPLAEVICEFRFEGNLEINTNGYYFQEKLKSVYPNLYLEKVKEGDYHSLCPIRFTNQDKSEGILLAINLFGFFSGKYCGHKDFLKKFSPCKNKFLSTFKSIKKFNRVGWRYINYIPFIQKDQNLPLLEFLNLSPELFKNTINLDLSFENLVEEGTVKTNLSVVENTQTREKAIKVDIDCGLQGNQSELKSLDSWIEKARVLARLRFEDLITPQFRTFLRSRTK